MSKKGRPLLFETPEDLQDRIDEYFTACDDHKKKIVVKDSLVEINDPLIPSIAGLAYYLGIDRHTVYNYGEKDAYFHTIKKARDYIFYKIEDSLLNSNNNAAGKIFLSKNYGYRDRHDVKVDIKGKLFKVIDDEFGDL